MCLAVRVPACGEGSDTSKFTRGPPDKNASYKVTLKKNFLVSGWESRKTGPDTAGQMGLGTN